MSGVMVCRYEEAEHWPVGFEASRRSAGGSNAAVSAGGMAGYRAWRESKRCLTYTALSIHSVLLQIIGHALGVAADTDGAATLCP